MHGFKPLAVAATLVAAVTPVAMADQVEVLDLGAMGNIGRAISVRLTGGLTFADGSSVGLIWAGRRSYSIDGRFTRAFTTQLTGGHGDGVFQQFSSEDVLDEAKSDALGALFAAHNLGELNRREDAVAFQAMIWEIVYDYDGTQDSINLAKGIVRIDTVNKTVFQIMKGSAVRGGPGQHLSIATNAELNDIVRIVPLPSSAALAGLGMTGLAVRRRRRS